MVPAVRSEPWWSRLWQRAAQAVASLRTTLDLGADYHPGVSSRPGYDVEASMSALAAFPWVYAALMRSSGDLAGLPLRGYQIRAGGQAQELERNHPLLRLLRRPHPRFSGRQLRRQLYVDLRLTGNAFPTRLGVGGASTILRLHPRRVEIRPSPKNFYGEYVYNAAGIVQVIPAEQVYHVRAPSWQDDPQGLWGAGAIESLHHDLTADRRAAQAAANLSKRPRPDIIVTPTEAGEALGEKVRDEIGKKLDRLLGDGGTLVLPSSLKVDLPSWSPRDLEFPAQRQLVREAILAVTGVPPHLVGLPTANYAQAREQTLSYWELQQAIAADFEDAFFAPLAETFGEDLVIRHDFGGVDALQEARSGRLGRVQQWWAMGADPSAAAKYEGFSDLPEALFPGVDPVVEEPAKEVRRGQPPTGEEARTAAWTGWLEKAHKPAERRLSGTLQTFLAAQAARVAERAAAIEARSLAAPHQRDLVDTLLSLLWEEAVERLALEAAVRGQLRELLLGAWRASMSSMQLSLPLEAGRIDAATASQVAELISQVNGATKRTIREIVLEGLSEGVTISDLQRRIQVAAAFSPQRALAVARTEATRSLDGGTQAAYQQAQLAGVMVRKQWLSARDSATRDAHAALDGQTVSVGEDFVIPSGPHAGAKAAGPGRFSQAALVVNCRCTTIPVVED